MCRKLFLLLSFVVVLGLANPSLGWISAQINFTGGDPCGAPYYWDVASNWDTGKVPVDGNSVYINQTGKTCLIEDGIAAMCGGHADQWGMSLFVAGGGSGNVDGTLDVTGGSLTVTSNSMGCGFTVGCEGVINISGGTINIPGGSYHCGYSWNGHGVTNMTGGALNINTDLNIQTTATDPTYPNHNGQFYLNGGTVQVAAGTLNIGDHEDTVLDIGGGTLILPGDKVSLIDGFIATEDIVPYGGSMRAEIKRDYNVTNASKTTVWAEWKDLAKAWNPKPKHGAVEQSILTTLAWTPGDYAPATNGHYVYLGTADDALVLQPGQPQTPNTYDPGQLEYDTTYYWRIDEVNTGGGVNQGDVWMFSVKDHDVVDDFESYGTNAELKAVWTDGWWAEDSGSLVNLSTFPVHGDDSTQSMEYAYDNDGSLYDPDYGWYYPPMFSEAYMDLVSTGNTDLTRADATTLVIWFRGQSDNDVEPMYAGLEGSYAQVDYPGSNDIRIPMWQEWNINLSEFAGVDASDVDKLYIGFGTRGGAGSAGGSGVVYFDDIRIYPQRCLNLDEVDLTGDLNGDCVVDWKDMAETAEQWLDSGISTTP